MEVAQVAATVRLDIPCFPPSKALFSTLAPFKRGVDVCERSVRSNRLVVCFSSAVLRVREPVDSARRPFPQIDAERNGFEDAEQACEGSGIKNVEKDELFVNGRPGDGVAGLRDSARRPFRQIDAERNGFEDTEEACKGSGIKNVEKDELFANGRPGDGVAGVRDHEDDGDGVSLQCRSFNGALSSSFHAKASSSMVDERERLRRLRISLANKGKTPWNKGKCHSPETIARMKEYSKAAMQNPQIRERLRQYSHPQSQETREKIRKFMKSRMAFERGQLTILQEWKDYIASMARNGIIGDDVLQWDSYQVLKKELQRQYYAAIKENQKDSRPKFLQYDHKQRISESIKAKWADSEYRTRIVTRIREARPQRQKVSKGKLIDAEFDLILDSHTSISNVSFYDSVLPHDVKLGSYNDPLSKEKLKKIKLLQLQNATRKETQSDLETMGSELVGINREARTDLKQEKEEKETNLSVQDTRYNGSDLKQEKEEKKMDLSVQDTRYNGSSSQAIDIISLHQAQYEAAERARILLAEAEQAAIFAAQALDAAGGYDERLSNSLLETWTLLDEASKYISASKVNKCADGLI